MAAAPSPSTQWVTDLTAFYKAPGAGGSRSLRKALRRRTPGFAGQSYALLEHGLLVWHRSLRLSEIYMHGDVYFPQEMLTTGSQELIDECVDKGTTHDDAQWNGNRSGLDDFLVAAHLLDLQAEFAALAPAPAPAPLPPPAIWEAFAPSHPSGLGPWLPNSGRYRTHFALKRVGTPSGVAIPADAASFLGMALLRILELNNTMVGWQGLSPDTKPYIISASLCGLKDNLNPTQDVVLEGFGLVQPFRLFEEELAMFRH